MTYICQVLGKKCIGKSKNRERTFQHRNTHSTQETIVEQFIFSSNHGTINNTPKFDVGLKVLFYWWMNSPLT